MSNYTEKLRKHNLKVTPQRLAICEALHVNGHLSIDDLYNVMLKKFSSLSLATIYKNVNLMVKSSFIKEIKIPNAKSIYELIKDSHAHLVCEKCGSVEDIDINIDFVISDVLKNQNFKVNNIDLVLSGICKKCQ